MSYRQTLQTFPLYVPRTPHGDPLDRAPLAECREMVFHTSDVFWLRRLTPILQRTLCDSHTRGYMSRFAKTPHSRASTWQRVCCHRTHANIRYCRSSVRTYDLVCCARRVTSDAQPVCTTVTDPQTGVAQDSLVTRAAMCVRLVDVRITCGLHDDAQLAAVFIDPRAK